MEAGYWTGALGLGLQPSRKTICSGGVVSCRVCPRRATRVFREVAWPAVTVKQPIILDGQERREAGQLTVPASSRERYSASRRNSFGTMTSRPVSWVRDTSRNPVKVASWAQTPFLAVRAVTVVAARVLAQVHVQLGVEGRVHPSGRQQPIVYRAAQLADIQVHLAAVDRPPARGPLLRRVGGSCCHSAPSSAC